MICHYYLCERVCFQCVTNTATKAEFFSGDGQCRSIESFIQSMGASTCMHSVYFPYMVRGRGGRSLKSKSKTNRSKGRNVNKNLGTYGIHICKHIVHVRHMSRLCTKSIYLYTHRIYRLLAIFPSVFDYLAFTILMRAEAERE